MSELTFFRVPLKIVLFSAVSSLLYHSGTPQLMMTILLIQMTQVMKKMTLVMTVTLVMNRDDSTH